MTQRYFGCSKGDGWRCDPENGGDSCKGCPENDTEQPEELAELRRKAAAFDWIEQNCHYIEAYDSTDWWWNKEVDGGLLKAIEQAKDGG